MKRSNYIDQTVRSLEIRIKDHVEDIKFEKRRTALSGVNIREDIDVFFFKEVKIIYKSQLKLQNLIRESSEIMTRKNNVSNNSLLNIHKIWLELLRIAVCINFYRSFCLYFILFC